ncbi:MAG: multicopper oxidase domain-containing protein [Deltaproteobacteria bacterium]|nr:multicopper oxidase domain-containing protein [Deltaproteobacteria bacterium]
MPVRTSAHAFIALALVASLVGCRSKAPVVEDPAAQARRQLEEELTSAYSMNAPPVSGIQSFELTAAPTSIQQFDGRLLDVWAYNGTVPGPVLRVRLGEEIEVKLHNRLPQPTTIHWHGVRVPNAMDGVPGVTQEAVAPGASFTYRFTPKDAGTFWFHPHVRTAEQVERGLYGVLIVDDAAPRPYSRDEVWVLDDWRLGPDGQIDPNFVTRHDLAHDGRWGQLVTVNGETSQELIVRPGERIRLRLVNTSNGRVYRPDFSGLDPRIIAVDGMYTRSHPPTGWIWIS